MPLLHIHSYLLIFSVAKCSASVDRKTSLKTELRRAQYIVSIQKGNHLVFYNFLENFRKSWSSRDGFLVAWFLAVSFFEDWYDRLVSNDWGTGLLLGTRLSER